MSLNIIKLLSIYTYTTDKTTWSSTLPDNVNIISYQLDGRYDHTFSFGKLEVKKDHVFNISSKETYSVQRIKKGSSICVTFTSNIPIKTQLIDCSNDPRYAVLFRKLLTYKSIGIKSNYYMALSIIYEIFSLLNKNSADEAKSSVPPIFAEAHDYLLENFYDVNVNLNALSKNSGLSDKYFRETFKKLYGSTPTQFLINLRLNEAAKLLSLKFMTVSEVAEAVGIPDVYYFSRLFKKKFGTSPGKY